MENDKEYNLPLDNVTDKLFLNRDPESFKNSSFLKLTNLEGIHALSCKPKHGNNSVYYSLEIVEHSDLYFVDSKSYTIVIRPQITFENLLSRAIQYKVCDQNDQNNILEQGTIEKGQKVSLIGCSLTHEVLGSFKTLRFVDAPFEVIYSPKLEKQPESITMLDESQCTVDISISHEVVCATSKNFCFYSRFWIRNETQMQITFTERKVHQRSLSSTASFEDSSINKRVSKENLNNPTFLAGQSPFSLSRRYIQNESSTWYSSDHDRNEIFFNRKSSFQFRVWNSSLSKNIRIQDVDNKLTEEFELKKYEGGFFNVVMETYNPPKIFWRTKIIV